jgi:hypothetical protein
MLQVLVLEDVNALARQQVDVVQGNLELRSPLHLVYAPNVILNLSPPVPTRCPTSTR